MTEHENRRMTELLRTLHLPFPAPDTDSDRVRARLISAGVTCDVILEPAAADPRSRTDSFETTLPLRAPRRAEPAPRGLPVSAAPGDGLRLMPLAGFFWGGPVHGSPGHRNGAATPRVRGDHVLVLVAQGALAIELPRMRHPVTQGRLAFIPAGTAFSLHPPPEVQGWALLIPPAVVRDLPVPLPDSFHCGLPAPADRTLLEPTLNALGQGSPRSPAETTATHCQLGLLSVALSRLSARAEPYDASNCRLAEARPLAQRFIEMISDNLAQDLTMAEIAGNLGCSLAHLDRACQHSRGRSALELIYAIRRDRAAQLLRQTDKPLAQIATELGYSGLGHFMRAFAAATGRTPESFRARAQNPQPFGE